MKVYLLFSVNGDGECENLLIHGIFSTEEGANIERQKMVDQHMQAIQKASRKKKTFSKPMKIFKKSPTTEIDLVPDGDYWGPQYYITEFPIDQLHPYHAHWYYEYD